MSDLADVEVCRLQEEVHCLRAEIERLKNKAEAWEYTAKCFEADCNRLRAATNRYKQVANNKIADNKHLRALLKRAYDAYGVNTNIIWNEIADALDGKVRAAQFTGEKYPSGQW